MDIIFLIIGLAIGLLLGFVIAKLASKNTESTNNLLKENIGKLEQENAKLKEKEITIDVLVAGVGTGGSLRGLGERLRYEHNPHLEIHAVLPRKNPTKIEGLHPGHIRGWFKIWEDREKEFTNGPIFIDDESAIKRAIEINKNNKNQNYQIT